MAVATQPQILHLAQPNPHICNVLSLRPGMRTRLCMARQLGCASSHVMGSDQGAITGISGFAFQGTNAHVVMTRCQEASFSSIAFPMMPTLHACD